MRIIINGMDEEMEESGWSWGFWGVKFEVVKLNESLTKLDEMLLKLDEHLMEVVLTFQSFEPVQII